MKTIILIMGMLLSITLGAQDRLDYHLRWDGKSSFLKVKLNYTAARDSTLFEFANAQWGGQQDIFNVVKNLKCSPKEKMRIDEKTRQITVYHKDRKTKTLTYEIDGALPEGKKPTIYTELFRPVITKDFLYVVSTFFMMKNLVVKNPEISVVWDQYPKKFAYFNSLNPQAAPHQTVSTDRESLGRRLFVMSDQLKVDRYLVGSIPYYALYPSHEDYKVLKTVLPPFFTDFFPSMRRYWKDDKAPFYFLAILPIMYGGKTGAGGFGMEEGFLMKYRGDFSIWEKYVVAHETSHNWIGQMMQLGTDSDNHAWFGEGFNDYIANIGMAESRVASKEVFFAYLNDTNIRKHYTSPVKDSANASIAKNFWKDKNYEKLPYRRGHIYAFYLDNQIRLASQGKYTLRNFMLDLFQLKPANINTYKLTMEEFLDKGAKYLPREQLQQEIENYMIKGTPIDFHTVKLIPEFEVYFEEEIPQIRLADGADLTKIYSW